ncbi:hypothetical protein [Prosthecobacter sp.]|uniref:hypothetical protein n=1 Tax=Prosthecobacter sp. TaxID=1965333 RepID=UPI0037842015
MPDPNLPQNDNRRSSPRGPQYPAFSLRDAIQKVRVVWDHEKRNPCPFNVLVSHWNFSIKSSGARTAVAALMRYRLLDRVGEEYKVSNLALSILLDGDDKAEALRSTALSPKIFADLWQKYGTDLPSEASLIHKLVLEGYNASSIPAIIKDWKDTIEFAGLKNGDSLDQAPVNCEDELDDHLMKSEVLALPRQLPAAPNKPSLPPMNPSIRYLPIPLMIGDAQIPLGMTEQDFELLIQSLSLWKPRIVLPAQPSTGSP